METLDPGHEYRLQNLDATNEFQRQELNVLIFVKREGENYPGNVGSHAGTILQECWRAEIARLKYLDNQIPCPQNTWCIANLRLCIYYLEIRAAQRHGTDFVMQSLDGIENLPTCPRCGHIFQHTCEGVSSGN